VNECDTGHVVMSYLTCRVWFIPRTKLSARVGLFLGECYDSWLGLDVCV